MIALTAQDRRKLELAGLIKPGDQPAAQPETTWWAVFRGKTPVAYFALPGLVDEWRQSAPHRANDRVVECRLRVECAPPPEPCFKTTPGPRDGVEYRSPYGQRRGKGA
jgi:hypothetical protein